MKRNRNTDNNNTKKNGTISTLYRGVKIPWVKIILGGFLAVFNSIVILTQYNNYMAIFTGSMKDLSPLFAYLTASFIQYILIFASIISSIALVTVVTGVRKKTWKKMLKLPVRTFEEETPEGVLSRITSDAEYASQPFTVVITVLQIVTYMMSMTAAAPKDLPQALPFLIVSLALAIVIIVISAKKISAAVTSVQNKKSVQTANYSEKLANLRLVKAAVAEEKVIDESLRLIDERYDADVKHAFAKGLQELAKNSTYVIIYSCAFLGGIVAISQSAIKDVAPINAIYVFGMALELTLVALMGVPSLFASTVGGTRKLTEIFSMSEEDIEKGNKLSTVGDIRLENGNFAYGEEAVLKDVNVVIPCGKTTAIIGTNGSGKSTLTKIIDRIYPLQNGDLFIGNERADDISLSSWREAFGIVSQEASLFSGSLRSNICYGLDREVSDQEIMAAVKKAGLLDVVNGFKEGLDYDIGLKGTRLSGGQQQRVAIARALLKDPQYLILDEATANLDKKTEDEVKAGLEELMKERTVIIVAHNYSAIQGADQIIVMNNGKVEACGIEEELIKGNKYYKQFAGEQ